MKRLVRIKVLPDSKRNEIIKGKHLVVKVKTPAQRGLANKTVIKLLSQYFKSKVRIVTGGKKPNKTVEIY